MIPGDSGSRRPEDETRVDEDVVGAHDTQDEEMTHSQSGEYTEAVNSGSLHRDADDEPKPSASKRMKRIAIGIYDYGRLPVILVVTFIAIRYSFGYSTHPGVNLGMATLLIDALLLRTRWNFVNIGCTLILNLFAIYVILRGVDPMELKVANWYVLCALFISITQVNTRKTEKKLSRS